MALLSQNLLRYLKTNFLSNFRSRKFGRIFRNLCFLYLFTTAFRLSTCPLPPPMIREYDYDFTQDEALSICRDVLTTLEYEIGEFDLEDHYIVSEIVTRRFFLKKVDYLIYVSVEDRVRVVLYAEERLYKKFSEWGVSQDNLTELEPSDRLSLSIQNRIYEQLTKALKKREITFRHPVSADIRDEKLVYKEVNRDLRQQEINLERSHRKELNEYNLLENEYSREKDIARLHAVEVAENHLSFYQSDDNRENMTSSLITVARRLEEQDELLEERMKLLLAKYPNYGGLLLIDWVIDIEGRVRSVTVTTETSPSTPDVDLKRVISNHFRAIVFPPLLKSGFIRLQRIIEFEGNRHRFTSIMKPPKLVETLETIPITLHEENSQILFEKSPLSKSVQ